MTSSASMTVPISAIAGCGGNTKAKSIPIASGQPAEHARERVAERDAEQPAGERDDEAFGGEDAPDLAGAGADAAQHADLAGALEHAHGDRVDERRPC